PRPYAVATSRPCAPQPPGLPAPARSRTLDPQPSHDTTAPCAQESAMSTSTHPDIARIRSLALVGQTAAGKTCLVEALLWKAGAVGAPGSLERGTTVSDFDPMERRVQHSLNASLVHFAHHDASIHLIDTPGYADFVGQSMTALEAVDTAAIVINAQVGIEMMTSRMMEWAHKRELCRMIIVNKIDAQGVDLPGLVAQIQIAFG